MIQNSACLSPRVYRIAFLSTVMLGNANRYRVLRAHVEKDPTVLATWAPLRSWVQDDWLGFLPGWWRVRLRHLLDSSRVFLPGRYDAVVLHAPEMWGVYGNFHSLFRRKGALINNGDAGRISSGRLATWLQDIADERCDLFLPWTHYVANDLRVHAKQAFRQVEVLAPGIPLDVWQFRGLREPQARSAFRIVFVGGEPIRKGLDTLVAAIEPLGSTVELHIATHSAMLPGPLASKLASLPNVRLHLDLKADTPALRNLVASADVFALPTTYDTYGFAIVEAMATGVPVIGTKVGGIPDIIIHEKTGLLVNKDDTKELSAAIVRMRDMPPMERIQMIENGRKHVEQHHDAAKNANRLIELAKRAADFRAGRVGDAERTAWAAIGRSKGS
jgi:glycosyltransferase involved in cell wall biosynthesis